jgi:sulfite dehydrogenase
MNTCYSFVSANSAMHVASVHAYDAKERTLLPVKGGGVSDKASELEGTYAWGWAKNIWTDSLA